MKIKPLKVSEVNSYIARIISNDVLLYNVGIEGEVSNCKYHTNGHIYFSLKDSKSRIRVVMFRDNAEKNEFTIEDGMNIVVSGYVNVYERDGSYQLYAKSVEQMGKGKLFEEFEKLKKKLMDEGLFDEDTKLPLPENPKKIGIATSITGAAIRDLIINLKRRNRLVEIIIAPTLVQGTGSAESILDSINTLQDNRVDLIILGRGGGSIEDLASFNDEAVARAIHSSKIPVISAVGHETDFTIADFAADKRASTPSTAAEIAVPMYSDMKDRIDGLLSKMIYEMSRKSVIEGMLLDNLKQRLMATSPVQKMENSRRKLDSEMERLIQAMDRIMSSKRSEVDFIGGKLDALSPLKTLKRGYSIVEKNGSVIESVAQLDKEDEIKILLSDGDIEAKVAAVCEKIDNIDVNGIEK